MSTKYAVTIKCIKQGYKASESETLKVFTDLLRVHRATYTCYVFERDKLNRVHLHGTIQARKNLKYNLLKVPFWHIYITHLAQQCDYDNWLEYINKDVVHPNGDYQFVDPLKLSID